MSLDVAKLVANAKRAAASRLGDANITPTAKIVREKSAIEKATPYRPYGAGLLICVHSVCYFVECASCKRDSREAKRNFEEYLRKHPTT